MASSTQQGKATRDPLVLSYQPGLLGTMKLLSWLFSKVVSVTMSLFSVVSCTHQVDEV